MAELGLNAVSVLNSEISADFQLSVARGEHSALDAGTLNKQPRSWNSGLVCLPPSLSFYLPFFFFFLSAGVG